ncbi:MAG TPA: ABC transporter permease [Opitutaceae bacterium]
MSDLRFALRQLAKSPGYTLVVVLTLAFGIAVNTTIFGMVNLFFLKPLPVSDGSRLVYFLQRSEAFKMPHGLSFPDFKDYRERLSSTRDLVAFMPSPVNLSASGKSPWRAWVEIVTPNAFGTLGVQAAVGRTLLPSDGEEKSAAVAVLNHDCWQQQFGGDPAIVGRAIVLNSRTFTVVGVAAPGFGSFSYGMKMSAFVPTGALESLRENGGQMLADRGAAGWRVMGRLTEESSLDQARSEAALVFSQLAQAYPDQHRKTEALVVPEDRARPDPIFADFMPVLAALFTGLVGLVLFIACANVANLMLARAASRQKELTMRAALGATRSRLIRQLLVESIVLAVLAGVVGWIIASWIGELLVRFAPQGDFPVHVETETLWQEYVFTAAISLIAGLASGLLPALRASRIDVVEQLKDGGSGRASSGRHRLRNFLVISQVMFSFVVLIGAGLFLQSLRRVQSVELGFRPENLLLLSFDLSLQGYSEDRAQQFHRQLLERVQALGGVRGASLTSHIPFDYAVSMRNVWPENPPAQMAEGRMLAGIASVAPGFTEMFGVTLQSGRTLAETDTAKTPRVAVINAEMARACWPGQEAVGKRFRPWRDGPWTEVVGVTQTAKYVMLAEAPRPHFYVPLAQDYAAPATLMLRTAGDPTALTSAAREAVRSLDPHLPVYNVRTMEELIGNSIFALMPLRMGATLAAVQGVLGLLLSIMGLYAVVSFGVAQRTREIGIRMALGAAHTDVRRLVMREGLRLTLVGIGIGLTFALALGFGLSRVLYGLSAIDPMVFPLVTILLVAISALACWLPARRATQVDPMTALRAE